MGMESNRNQIATASQSHTLPKPRESTLKPKLCKECNFAIAQKIVPEHLTLGL